MKTHAPHPASYDWAYLLSIRDAECMKRWQSWLRIAVEFSSVMQSWTGQVCAATSSEHACLYVSPWDKVFEKAVRSFPCGIHRLLTRLDVRVTTSTWRCRSQTKAWGLTVQTSLTRLHALKWLRQQHQVHLIN